MDHIAPASCTLPGIALAALFSQYTLPGTAPAAPSWGAPIGNATGTAARIPAASFAQHSIPDTLAVSLGRAPIGNVAGTAAQLAAAAAALEKHPAAAPACTFLHTLAAPADLWLSSYIVAGTGALLLDLAAAGKLFRTSLGLDSGCIAHGTASDVPAPAAGTFSGTVLAAAATLLPSCNDLHMTGHGMNTFASTPPLSTDQISNSILPRR